MRIKQKNLKIKFFNFKFKIKIYRSVENSSMKQEIERFNAVLLENNQGMETEKARYEAHLNELNQTLSLLQEELNSKNEMIEGNQSRIDEM